MVSHWRGDIRKRIKDGVGQLWTTTNGGTSWTIKATTPISGRVGLTGARFFYFALADENIFYILCFDGGGKMCVGKTTDYGTSWTDVSQYGTANAVDTVLGTGNYAGQIVLVDYYKV